MSGPYVDLSFLGVFADHEPLWREHRRRYADFVHELLSLCHCPSPICQPHSSRHSAAAPDWPFDIQRWMFGVFPFLL